MQLQASGVSHSYSRGAVRAVDAVTFDVEGDCVGLLGPNGAGKSTLLSLLTGALPLQSGSLLPGREGGQLGYVPQDLRIDPSLTVEHFLAYCAWLKKLPRAGWELQISRVLELTDVQDRRSARVGSLSGGLLRRVALAQALLGEPSMIVLDEPTNALDPGQRHALRSLLREVKSTVGIVVSTHLVEDVVAVADAIVILDQGRVAWQGRLDEIVTGPNPAADLEQFFLTVTG